MCYDAYADSFKKQHRASLRAMCLWDLRSFHAMLTAIENSNSRPKRPRIK